MRKFIIPHATDHVATKQAIAERGIILGASSFAGFSRRALHYLRLAVLVLRRHFPCPWSSASLVFCLWKKNEIGARNERL